MNKTSNMAQDLALLVKDLLGVCEMLGKKILEDPTRCDLSERFWISGKFDI